MEAIKMATKKGKQQTLSTHDAATQSKLDYLSKLGIDAKPDDLSGTLVDRFDHSTDRPQEVIGNDVHPGFDYYRAKSKQSIDHCIDRGYIQLPKDADIRMRGGRTEDEVWLARSKEVSAAFNKSEHERRQAMRRGTFQKSTPLRGSDANVSETITRSVNE